MAIAAVLLTAAAPGFAAPPALNLVVELRAFEQSAGTTASEGGFVVATRGGSPAAAGSLQWHSGRADEAETQQVLVRNGGRATLHASRPQALPTSEWVWGGNRAGVGSTRQWIDAGRGFAVRATWPGGQEPVKVEIQSGGATAAATELVMPLDEWLTFARHADGAGETLLQLRVSLPNAAR